VIFTTISIEQEATEVLCFDRLFCAVYIRI